MDSIDAVAHTGLNDATGAFLPKGTDERDSTTTGARTRDAAATPPLSLRNTDAKILAMQVNKALAATLPAWASARQRGFVQGRGPLEHVIELDGAARRHTPRRGDVVGGPRRPRSAARQRRHSVGSRAPMPQPTQGDARSAAASRRARSADTPPIAEQGHRPALFLFHFSSAFPSIDCRFVRTVAQQMQAPRSQMRVGRDEPSLAVDVNTGVPQGCPMRGSSFAMATRCIIHLLATVVPQCDIFMYADDLALIVRDVSMARDLIRIFGIIERISALKLNIKKCKVLEAEHQGPLRGPPPRAHWELGVHD